MPAVLRNYLLMLKWNMLSSKPWLAMLFAVQLMMTVGFVIGVGFFFPQMDPNIARYLITGTPTLNLMMTLPGVILSLVIGSAYHDFTLQVSPLVIPAFLP